MFGVTLLMPTPFTNRPLKADPVELTEEAEPLAVVVATPRTRLAVTSPLRMFTLAASATLVCFAWAGDSATVLVLEVRITSARRSSPLGWGTLTLSIWLLLLVEPTPAWLLETGTRVWLIPSIASLI